MTGTRTQTTQETQCWSCGAGTNSSHFCPACGKIQPLPPDTDYFTFFGLPQKLVLDVAELERRFHELSWKLHPDRFAQAGEQERRLSLDRSAQLNDAFRTLREPVRRVEYLLWLAGKRKEGQSKQLAPPELLEEVFELNESLDELRRARQAAAAGSPRTPATGGSEKAALRQRLEMEEKKFQAKLKETDEELMAVAAEWDRALEAGVALIDNATREALLARMNEILNRRSYIRNLVENVRQELVTD